MCVYLVCVHTAVHFAIGRGRILEKATYNAGKTTGLKNAPPHPSHVRLPGDSSSRATHLVFQVGYISGDANVDLTFYMMCFIH